MHGQLCHQRSEDLHQCIFEGGNIIQTEKDLNINFFVEVNLNSTHYSG